MTPQRTILLLNASNLKTALVYPYAFVQVSEIADRFNIRTICNDMYGITEKHWEGYLQKLLKNDLFNMILITLRNTDCVDVNDYQPPPKTTNYYKATIFQSSEQTFYYPIQATKRLVQVLRKLTDVPVVIGGFAFSMMPEKLMNYLNPDYGVIGGPDAFFEYFEEVLEKQHLNQIANLIYFQGRELQRGPLQYFPPAYRQEYTDKIIKHREEFYSRFSEEPLELSVPIEVSRGCPMRCTMCPEPLIKGKKVQYRNLDVIKEEINFLQKYQLNQLFFICSELNAEGDDFVTKLADLLIEINQEREEDEKVSWYGLHLLTFTAGMLRHIRKAGYCGVFNPLPVGSLEDHNLRANKAPQKSEDIINFFTQAKKLVKDEFRHSGKKYFSLEERIFRSPESLNPDDFVNSWNIFLGNIDVTPETIRVTLKRADDAGLNRIFDSCYMNKATRIYDFMHPTEELLSYTWSSVNGGIKNSYNELYPSFTYPPALLHHFRNAETLDEFMVLVGDTYLSRKHLFKKDWAWFLTTYLEPETFLFWWKTAIKSEVVVNRFTAIPEVLEFLTFLQKNPSLDNIKLFFNPPPGRKNLINFAAHISIQIVLFSQEKVLDSIMERIGLPPLKTTLYLSPYKVAVELFKHYSNKNELMAVATDGSIHDALSCFLVDYLLYLTNIPFNNEFQIFFLQ
ncbi:MAG: hypothetical protein ACFE9A_15715 [Candidatus Hodarchaeota archaeon]